jgi:hypothetical protein
VITIKSSILKFPNVLKIYQDSDANEIQHYMFLVALFHLKVPPPSIRKKLTLDPLEPQDLKPAS